MGKGFVTKVDLLYVYSNFIFNIRKQINLCGYLSSRRGDLKSSDASRYSCTDTASFGDTQILRMR